MMLMDSGAYRVQHSHCAACSAPVGWKFVRASERTEKWKEGYFILELTLLHEELAPPSPLEAVQMGMGYQLRSPRMMELMGGGGHRRTASDAARQRPLGPRDRGSTYESYI